MVQSNLDAMLSGDNSPIKAIKDAWKWLDSEGWVLSGEAYDCGKLVRILLTTALSLSAATLRKDIWDAHNACLLLEDKIMDMILDALSETVTDKILTRLNILIANLGKFIKFYTATDKAQANMTIALSTVINKLVDITNTLTSLLTNLKTQQAASLALPM
ncbi:hypothetical protein H0H87_006725 [Tephrocybe sp. NHM501043]|nr:hypothetical protein H0H87_006725 [Tephrocybe sp. NHM501043]